MQLTGVVEAVNNRRGFFSVGVEDHGFVVMEILGDNLPAVGDSIASINDVHGGQTVRNVTQRQQLRVYVQALGATRNNARSLVFPR